MNKQINGREETALPYRKIPNTAPPSRRWGFILSLPTPAGPLDIMPCFQIIE